MTKKIFFSVLALFLINYAFAKKVKFAVDMGANTISPFGIHVMGDFQVVAGYSLNFDPGSTAMAQDGASTIYTIIVTIPAFQKYEFKFVNGDQSYEVEFVPEHARVGYLFNDNRWVYVDSLQNDTTFIGAVRFSENSPAGKTLLRYVVDMQNVMNTHTAGVHVGSTFQGNNPATHKLYNLDGTKYEIIGYMDNGLQTFKYYNGNTAIHTETVPALCATNANRTHNLTKDTILVTVCFSGCGICQTTGMKSNTIEFSALKIFPNPSSDHATITNPSKTAEKIIIVDVTGKVTDELIIENSDASQIELDLKKYNKGFYQVYLKDKSSVYHSKLLVQ